MKNEDVIKSFLKRRECNNTTLHSTGNRLYSYSTCIAEFDLLDRLWYNATKYSRTTSKHQYLLRKNAVIYDQVDNVELSKRSIVPENLTVYE